MRFDRCPIHEHRQPCPQCPPRTPQPPTRSAWAGIAPQGWRVTATCVGCGFLRLCWGDGELFYCRSCYRATHGVDPATSEWELAA